MAEERNRLRKVFDEVALLYDGARPGYPGELFDDIVTLSGIPLEGRILEIGCGTGQATVPFARRGYHVVCIELGENMAALARRNLKGHPQVRTGDFEQMPLQERAFDL
ncbi:MAG TPA: class I SAM-dependent methyltransferase, partial [Rubrobacter sp.]|nr:class I SAM-dependent methyltransferase [Rubrobacter sp.]